MEQISRKETEEENKTFTAKYCGLILVWSSITCRMSHQKGNQVFEYYKLDKMLDNLETGSQWNING